MADIDRVKFQNLSLEVKLDEIESSYFFLLAQQVANARSLFLAILLLPFTAITLRRNHSRNPQRDIFNASKRANLAQESLLKPKIYKAGEGALNSSHTESLTEGISVVIPTYKGEAYIETCLTSLTRQTLLRKKFEIVVVINGERDSTPDRVADFRNRYPDLNLRVFSADQGNAGLARNIGIQNSKFSSLCFLDDDDTCAEHFLEKALEKATDGSIVVTSMIDIIDGKRVESSINNQILASRGSSDIQYHDVSQALSTNAGKIIPTYWAKMLAFDEGLSNGEDVVFWGDLITRFRPQIRIVAEGENGEQTAYERLVRPNSISRQSPTFEFMVEDRLDVIARLDNLAHGLPAPEQSYLNSKMRAQSGFIERYLTENPQDRLRVIQAVDDRDIAFPLKAIINDWLCEDLVISFCFPPFVDTAGVVTAKRLIEMGRPVDVISNAMFTTRKIDERLLSLTENSVAESTMLRAPESFANWSRIAKFSELTLQEIERKVASGRQYSRMYSRVLWPAANFPAAIYKMQNPDVYWAAEFSDPILKNIHGEDREGELSRSWLQTHGILSKLRELKYDIPQTDNLFAWCEVLAYIFADELIFTNPQQRDYMESYVQAPSLKRLIREKSTIRVHPTLPPRMYDLIQSAYKIDTEKVNVAYFGAFYATRGIGVVLSQFAKMSAAERDNVHFHIFTNQLDAVEALPEYKAVQDFVSVNNYIPYFEFLNLGKRFDYLLVNDTATIGSKPINPYLPSKLSDYAGMGRKIWALYEHGSVMSKLTKGTDIIRTDMNDSQAILETLRSF